MKTKIALAVCAAAALSAATAKAHHSAVPFFAVDTAVTIKGTIIRFNRANPHSYLYVDLETSDGRVERMTIEGPALTMQAARGIRPEALTPGASVVVCGYLLKDGVQGPSAREGRLLLAELVWTRDGERRLWSDYGNHHCRDEYGVDAN